MDHDPLITQGKVPAFTVSELLRAMSAIQDHQVELSVPVLAMHGTADQITNPDGSKKLVARARSTDRTLKLYEGLYHDLLHEPEKARVTVDLSAWLVGHLPPTDPGSSKLPAGQPP
jgi:alpha-beta hydrolase superfamily lysophospholipase